MGIVIDVILFVLLRGILFPIAIFGCWVSERKYELKVWLFKRTAGKIAEQLQNRGVKVEHVGYNALWNSCEVVAEITPEQVEGYQAVYAWAIKRFGWRCTPAQLCKSAKPLEHLNRNWAQSIGINEYGAERWSIPCRTCGARALWGIWWGDDASHQKPWNAYGKVDYSLVSRTVKTVEDLCDNCARQLVAAN